MHDRRVWFMAKDWKKLKAEAKKMFLDGKSLTEVSRGLDISRTTAVKWRKEFGLTIDVIKEKVQSKVSSDSKDKEILKKTCNADGDMALTKKMKAIRESLLVQLKLKGNDTVYFIDLVDDYIRLWKVKEMLDKDINERGVQIEYFNGANQKGLKKNDSVGELLKCNQQMIKLLDKLGLKVNTELLNDGDEDDDI